MKRISIIIFAGLSIMLLLPGALESAGAEDGYVSEDNLGLSANPIEVLSGNSNYFLKVDLDDPRVRIRVGLANTDHGGLETLSSMKNRYSGQGYSEWAIINGDLFSEYCPSYVKNCAQGLTYIDGQPKPNWGFDDPDIGYGYTWRGRGNLGLDSSFYPEVSVGDSQTKRHMVIGGGPRIVINGGPPVCNAVYESQPGGHCGADKTYFPHSNECFDDDVSYWCTDTRSITLVGYSADRKYLFMGISESSSTYNVVQLAQWLKDRGAYEVLRLDSGSSSGMYHNSTEKGTVGKLIANHLAVIVDNEPPPGNWNANYYDDLTHWWDNSNTSNWKCSENFSSSGLDKNYGNGAPCSGMDPDTWVGDYEGTVNFSPGNYVFWVEHDDGLKLWLNKTNIWDNGSSDAKYLCPARYLSGDQNLWAILREDGGDAKVKISWTTDQSVCDPPTYFTKSSPSPGSIGVSTSPTITWNPSTKVNSYEYCIDKSNNNTCDTPWIDVGNTTSKPLSGLDSGTTYYWQIRAVNPYGNTLADGGAWWSFTTLSPIPSPPSKPYFISATESSVTFGWDDNSDNENGFRIYKWGYGDNDWDFYYLGSVSANVTNYTDTGLQCDHGTWYRVTAYNAHGESNPSYWEFFSTHICPPGEFNKINPLNGAPNQSTGPTLSWEASSGATNYEYCYDTSNNNSCSNWASNDTDTSKTLSDLEPDIPYYWHVRAWSSNPTPTYSNGSSTAFWSFSTEVPIPSPPINLIASYGSYQYKVNITWDSSPHATHYEVYRSDTFLGEKILLDSVSSTSYDDYDVDEGEDYNYWIKACNSSGCSDFSDSTFGFPGTPNVWWISTWDIDDDNLGESRGNNNGRADPGEIIELNVALRNRGRVTANDVTATLVSDDPFVTILDNISSTYPDIPPNDKTWNDDDWELYIDPSAPIGHQVTFWMNPVTASNGGPWYTINGFFGIYPLDSVVCPSVPPPYPSIKECIALEKLFQNTNGSNWNNNEGWLSTSKPCDWFGVTCTNGEVIQLELTNNQLSGHLPQEVAWLENIEMLDLSHNSVVGEIPQPIGDLHNLNVLKIHNNQFIGSLPNSLANLSLQTFSYYNTGLCEPNDAVIQSWLDTIPDLQGTGITCSFGSCYLPFISK